MGEHAELALADTLLSATSLQAWAGCPARYFFANVLHVREQDDVAEVDELEARHRGSIVHEILERLGKDGRPKLHDGRPGRKTACPAENGAVQRKNGAVQAKKPSGW